MTRAEFHAAALALIVAGFIVLLWANPAIGGALMSAAFVFAWLSAPDREEG